MAKGVTDGSLKAGNNEPAKTRESKAESVSLSVLFSMADGQDKALMLLGTLAAVTTGAGMPLFIIYFGKVMDGFNASSDIKDVVSGFALFFLGIGAVAGVCGFIYVLCWTMAGERQALRLKETYVRSIFRQDIGWFDEHPAGQLPTKVTATMAKVQDGIGRKIPDILMNGCGGVGCVISSFILNPILSAILMGCLPFIGITVAMVTKLMSKSTIEGQTHYSEAGAVANEVIRGIRTIASLCAEPNEMVRYGKHLLAAETAGIKNGIQNGLGQGMMFFCFFLSYALAFWYGIRQVSEDVDDGCTSGCVTGGKVISAVFGVLFGAMQLGQMSPGVTALNTARAAAVTIFETIHRSPSIDAFSEKGLKPTHAAGELELDSVAFSYPARPDDLVYESINLKISVGETLALVGPSGGGKSTMTKLFLRFYDPTYGAIRLDGTDIRELNLGWYRQQIGYVGQEPILFAGSIRDNIANGKPDATDDEIIIAAKAANAHDFIKGFPDGYGTDVGESGLQLSGGQKQRVAIARAIIKDPSILLLDEATSALDSESEKVVQKALDRLHELKRRTTITIAHRLSTIQNSDRIAVVSNKGIAELGTHNELLSLGGIYAQLCKLQAGEDGNQGKDAMLLRESSYQEALLKRNRSQSSSVRMTMLSSGNKEKEDEQTEEDAPMAPIRRLWELNKPEWLWILMGILGATAAGSLMPLEGVLIAELQTILYYTDGAHMREEGNKWVVAFVGLAFLALVGHLMLSAGFGTSGERLTRRLREVGFKSILRHDIGWFDSETHSTGILTSNLESDANAMALATGTNLGHKIQLCMSLLLGVLIGVIVCYQIGLVAIGLIPLIGAAGVVQMAMISGGYGDSKGLDGGLSASSILGGALNAVTTVHAFNMQQTMCDRYGAAVKGTIKDRKKRGLISGLAFGYSQGVTFWVFGLLFWYGAILVDRGTITFLQFFMSMFAVILGAFGIGQVNADMGAQKKGQQAAARIFALYETEFKIDPLNEQGAKPLSVSGNITFKNLVFAYPSRPDQLIYGGPLAPEGFYLDVKAGDTVALVGPSGGGKSTCIALLLRFYDPIAGTILLDGRNIQELNLHWLRNNIGYVGQEPVLFTGSIKENILRGNFDASDEEVEAAARASNAHDFIMSFSEGYDTDVGEKSALLSGGQKQRIAIARAILKNPAILLLDEATSALDNESESQVQAALDQLQKLQRRTTLVVAHRLTTIRNADKIAVLGNGCVRELGTHDELMDLPGSTYANLYRRQTEMFRA